MGSPPSKSVEYKVVFIVTYYSYSGCLNINSLMGQVKEKYTLQIIYNLEKQSYSASQKLER